MNNPRSILLIALLLVSYLVWNQWQQDYAMPRPAAPEATAAIPGDAPGSDTPSTAPAPAVPGETPQASAPNASTPAAPTTAAVPPGKLVEVGNDVLKLWIDTRGGSIVRADLLGYPQEPKDYEHPIRLLDNASATYFVAQSGLVSSQGTAPDHQAEFTAEKDSYTLDAGQDSVEVPLTWHDAASGLTVRKVYVLGRGSYVLGTRQEIRNDGTTAWTGNAYRQLQRVPPIKKTGGLAFTNPESFSFAGAAWYSPEDKFKKIAFDKYTKEPLTNRAVTGGWVAMLQHYFFAAWLPPAAETEQYTTTTLINGGTTRYLIRAMGPSITVAPGANATSEARLYIGPKAQSTLNEIAPGLALTIDYGILTVLSEPLHWILAKLHAVTGNWGFAIILLVLLIKLAMFKLSETQFRSMAKMRKLAPRVQAINERYGSDPQKKNQAMMELYQKEKINPLGSCLPMLVQIPVFLALYWVLIESVELRHAPFIGWIQNLTAPDPYFVLPILNAATMIATQYLTPTTGMDPVQAKMMKIMPVVFSVMFAFFPAGLVLYWTVNGLSSLAQQYIITKRIEAVDAKA